VHEKVCNQLPGLEERALPCMQGKSIIYGEACCGAAQCLLRKKTERIDDKQVLDGRGQYFKSAGSEFH
jgi:hypothetical protein